MALVVECVGVAGVGKSHLATLLARELEALGVSVSEAMGSVGPVVPKWRRVGRKLRFAVTEVARDPPATLSMARAVAGTGQQRGRDTCAMFLNWLTLRALIRREARTAEIVIFDQATIIGLWSAGLLGAATPCQRVLQTASWSWLLPDAVVHIHAPTEQNIAQLHNRPGRQSRLEQLDDARLARALFRAESEVETLVEWWRSTQAHEALVVDVTNSGDDRLLFDVRAIAAELAPRRTLAPTLIPHVEIELLGCGREGLAGWHEGCCCRSPAPPLVSAWEVVPPRRRFLSIRRRRYERLVS
jgi:thymidylate kinase